MEVTNIISKEKKVGIFIVDQRQVYMEKMLRKMGYQVFAWDLLEGQMPAEEEAIWQVEVLLLPVPVSRLKALELLCRHLQKAENTVSLCIGGLFPKELQEVLTEENIPWIDVLQDQEVAIKNAVATAEGTVAELAKLMPVNIEGAHILVMGFGNCGKPIAEKLYCMGANISVVARSEKARSLAHYYGYLDYPMDGCIPFHEVDAIVNTIPALVIGKKEMDLLKEDAVILDIASAPGGCDGAYCKEKGIPYKLALGLPGIYAPKSSAQILLEAMPFGISTVERQWKS